MYDPTHHGAKHDTAPAHEGDGHDTPDMEALQQEVRRIHRDEHAKV